MLKIPAVSFKADFDYTFEEIRSSRNDFMTALGSSRLYARDKLAHRAARLSALPVVDLTRKREIVLTTSLAELMVQKAELVLEGMESGALFLCLFMRIYSRANQEQRAALLAKWAKCLGSSRTSIEFLFELGVGNMYTFLGNEVYYADLANGRGQFDWLVRNNESEVSVEVKTTRWSTGRPISDLILDETYHIIQTVLDRPSAIKYNGYLQLVYTGKSQPQSAVIAIPTLTTLLSQKNLMKNDRRSSRGPWTANFVAMPPPYNITAREKLKKGTLADGLSKCEAIAHRTDGSGPLCGINFCRNWDHGRAILRRLKEAFSQVTTQTRSAIWIQMSGMPVTSLSAESEFSALLRSFPHVESAFYQIADTEEQSGFLALHLARDFEFFFKPHALAAFLKNAIYSPGIIIPSERFNRFRHYSEQVLKNPPGGVRYIR